MIVKDLRKLKKTDIKDAGNKAVILGQLMRLGFCVPDGFVILAKDLEFIFGKEKNLPKEFVEEILNNFEKLNTDLVAVRSSALAEDLQGASWAGIFKSYLNVSKNNLLENIEKCWRADNDKRVEIYLVAKKIAKMRSGTAVIVQKMVNSEISGVCFTAHPVSNNKKQIVIEASRGLGENVAGGKVIPAFYVVENKKVAQKKDENSVLSEKQVFEIAEVCQKIAKYFQYSQDIEWAFAKNKLYILQARPITTL